MEHPADRARRYPKALTADALRSQLNYDASTGVFTWRNGRRANEIAGHPSSYGYWLIRIGGRSIPAHRLAWLYVTGNWPQQEIDHIDSDRLNNRFVNLRDVSRTVNGQNLTKAMSSSRTGLLGAHPHRDRFAAQIRVNGRVRHIGLFDTALAAHQAYLAAKRKLHKGCTI
jgi:hypothetical protein